MAGGTVADTDSVEEDVINDGGSGGSAGAAGVVDCGYIDAPVRCTRP